MAMLKLPYELLMLIARRLGSNDLNALLKCHPHLYKSLNDYLYYHNVHHHDASALFWAATSGSEVTLQRLLDAGANVRWESQYWACSWSPPSGNHLREPAEGMKEHPISYSASHGHIGVVSTLLELGVDINYQDPDGLSPVALAAREGHFNIVRMLVSMGARQLTHDTEGRHPLGNAASQGHHAIEDLPVPDLAQPPRSEHDLEHQDGLLLDAEVCGKNRGRESGTVSPVPGR